jgi:uncharacterized protein
MSMSPVQPCDTASAPQPYPCLSLHATGVCLSIVVVPNARHTHVVGLHDGALRVQLAAQAIEGRANAALLGWLADELGLPKRAVVLLSGITGRRKKVAVQAGLEHVRDWLRRSFDAAA